MNFTELTINYLGSFKKYKTSYSSYADYNFTLKDWKQTYLSHQLDNTISNTICLQLSCVQERRNMYTDTYAQIYINYSMDTNVYTEFDRYYKMTYEELDKVIKDEKVQKNKEYLLKLRQYKQFMNCTDNKDELHAYPTENKRALFDLHDIYNLPSKFVISIGQCVLGTHMISQDGEFRPIVNLYSSLRNVLNDYPDIKEYVYTALLPRFKEEKIKVRVMQNDIGLPKDKVELINTFILDTDIWFELYVCTWLINANKYINGDFEDNFNSVFFMSFMINKEIEKDIYEKLIINHKNVNFIKGNIRTIFNDIKGYVPTGSKEESIPLNVGQKMIPMTVKESICILENKYEYIQGNALRELTLLKRLELLMYNKIMPNIPFVYNWFVLTNMDNTIIANDFQTRKNKISDALKAINDTLRSVDTTIEKEQIEAHIKQYIGMGVDDLMKYNDTYVYLPNTYIVIMEEYEKKPLANIKSMITKDPNKDFFTPNKINRYMFELLYIGNNLGQYGIINGDAHLNNVCVAYNNRTKIERSQHVQYICYEMIENNRDSWVVFKYDSTYISLIDFSRGIINDWHLEEICKGMSEKDIAYFKRLERDKMLRYYRYNLTEFYNEHKELIDNVIYNRYNEFFYIYGYIDAYSVINKFINYLRALKLNIDEQLLTIMTNIKDDIYEIVTTQFVDDIKNEKVNKNQFIHFFVEKYFRAYNFNTMDNDTYEFQGRTVYPIADLFGLKSVIKDEKEIRDQIYALQIRPSPIYTGESSLTYNYLCVKELLYRDYKYTQDKSQLSNLIKDNIKYVTFKPDVQPFNPYLLTKTEFVYR